MQEHRPNPRKSLNTQHFKDTEKRHTQLNIVRAAFYHTPSTMLMIAHVTGIERASVCRFVATLRKLGVIRLVRMDACHITGFKAGFYTTNTAKINGGRKGQWDE